MTDRPGSPLAPLALLATSWIPLAALCACGGDDDGAPDAAPHLDARAPVDWPEADVPAATTPEPGIRREIFTVDGVAPPPNPVSGELTPTELDRTVVVRYRQAGDPVAPHAVVVAFPGLLGGAGSFDGLARNLVRGGAARDLVVEVWAIDRRSNLLEDRRGVDAAEAVGDPELANFYYYGDDTIAGVGFAGFVDQDAVPYMSEWGLATHVDDLRAVIDAITGGDDAAGRDHVFLLGHSLGGGFTEAYAAWRFADGVRGVEQLAGLILVDGALGDAPASEADWHDGVSGGLFSVPGVDELRGDGGDRYLELPFFGVDIFPRVEVLALRARLAPDAVVADPGRDEALVFQLSLGALAVPPMTNAAALGWGFDDDSAGIPLASASMGDATGGPVGTYQSAFFDAELLHPTSATATYAWLDATADDPDDFTPMADLIAAFVDGRTNFAEWYFPQRLSLDLQAVGGAQVPDDGWQAAEGLRAFDGALIDAPILAIAADFVRPADYDAVRARVAPTVGAGRPGAGAARTSDAGFRVVDTPFTHLEPLLAPARPDNPVPPAVLDFVEANAAAGTIPARPAL